ncbi:hypothetical protein [Chitinophaga barathri]|uniref:Glycosyltransferase RgtA/B/C/D-like domain-containing protein n=1 Tax=Chitinophaga barathri TaxID=1647451 RepID=A0A3N4M7Y8_9BACT|nr:hypothetical protein [Chitinophaga barathri]RPD39674.1 hypothetical protein EG028_18690 [Chitinophaga barathri]
MKLPALTPRNALIIESLLIIVLAIVPLFVTFPYRVNIFLSWEGAYRLSEGQLPYKDFGLPLGYGYWLVPALFMKLFGPQLISLVKAQVFLNIAGGFAFRGILKNVGVAPGVRVLSVLLFVISYSFFNFWPWYNNTVIIYQFIGLAFLLCAVNKPRGRWKWPALFVAALFTFLSFFTKQDGGGLALLLALALLGYHSLAEKRWQELAGFIGLYILVACAFILPFVPYHFGYWFNHGQPPHSSRLALKDFVDEFLYGSQWLKFYFVMTLLVTIPALRNWKGLWQDKQKMLFLLLTLGILVEATLFQVTSYTPPDNNIFFHSFAFAYIFSNLAQLLQLRTEQWKTFLLSAVMVLLWWSGAYYRYVSRILDRLIAPAPVAVVSGGENVINRNNYQFTETPGDVPVSEWTFSSLPEFDKIYMPPSTVQGIDRVMALPEAKKGKAAKVLNLTELTPLDHALGYQLETGNNIPLWHHLGVGMFNSQLHDYVEKVRNKHYDLVLYEHAPMLNNFFPWALREELKQHYRQVDSFLAPRRPTNAIIEVFVK